MNVPGSTMLQEKAMSEDREPVGAEAGDGAREGAKATFCSPERALERALAFSKAGWEEAMKENIALALKYCSGSWLRAAMYCVTRSPAWPTAVLEAVWQRWQDRWAVFRGVDEWPEFIFLKCSYRAEGEVAVSWPFLVSGRDCVERFAASDALKLDRAVRLRLAQLARSDGVEMRCAVAECEQPAQPDLWVSLRLQPWWFRLRLALLAPYHVNPVYRL